MEEDMNHKVMTAVLAVALSIPAIAFAQNSGQQDDKNLQEEQNQAAMANMTGGDDQIKHTMSGMVSNNGTTFTSGDTSYVVNNPKSLQAYDNQSVGVSFQFNSDNNTIHIISVSPSQAPVQSR
jgi:hypothetical protein